MRSFNLRWSVAVLVVILAIQPAVGQESTEANKVHVLIAVDTHDQMGLAWGIDGSNFKDVLEATFRKQKVDAKLSVKMFTGKDVMPDKILTHFRNLKVAEDEVVLFFYSGHGGYHKTRGHFMALTYGTLFRKDLLAAMQKSKPRLTVVLTDCCADYVAGEIKSSTRPPRPPKDIIMNFTFVRAKRAEPPDGRELPTTGALQKVVAKAKVEEPAGKEKLGTDRAMVLKTGAGDLPLSDILNKTDGLVMRHLLLRHKGVVDINGCKKGGVSMGTPPWGGSLFTIAFMELQKDRLGKFDKNANNLVEWDEFFPFLRERCEAACRRLAAGAPLQSPEPFQGLAKPD